MKARDRDVHGALDAFLQPVDWLIAISDRYSQQAPCIVACPGLRGIRTHGTVTVEWFSSSKILMLVRAVP
jgi:hypothetical protein